MATHLSTVHTFKIENQTWQQSTSLLEGIIAGTMGAAMLMLWFLILDMIHGQVFYTPTVLGTALFHGYAGLAASENLTGSIDTVVAYTWAHWMVFVAVGVFASRLLTLAQRDPNLGFGILLLFVMFETGFLAVSTLFAQSILHALAWETVLVGNLLAAVAMGGYFWHQYPHLTVRP